MTCQHEITEIISLEPYLKGFSTVVAVECVACHAEMEVETDD